MRTVAILLASLLAACGSTGQVTCPPAPPAKVIRYPVPTYVPIDKALTAPCDWIKDERPSRVFDAARSRRDCLEQVYEPNFRAIRKVQGKPVPAKDPGE